MKKKKTWSLDQKLAVLHDGDLIGVAVSCRKHGVSNSMYYRWKGLLDSGGAGALEPSRAAGAADARRLRELEEENLRLKRIVADKELELQMQRELLKKRMSGSQGSGRS
jgi:putative transposase